MPTKMILARIPISYATWQRVGIFQHGFMTDPSYSFETFRGRWEIVKPPEDFVVLELGCGDSLATAPIARAFGASKVLLVDVGPFAITDLETYRGLATYLREHNSPCPVAFERAKSIDKLLRMCNAVYLTEGIASLRTIPAGSVDMIFSRAVLEHVRRHEFTELSRELRRVIRSTGRATHGIDLQDHLSDSLNNLRFSRRFWESWLIANSGFYTNRLRHGEIVESFRDAGWSVEVLGTQSWEKLPVSSRRLSHEFRAVPKNELLIKYVNVRLTPV